jgi:hypothetical protein
MATSIFVQTDAAPAGRHELSRVFGAVASKRVVPIERAPDHGIVHNVRQGLGFVLRQLARGLYLSPLLIVAKLVLRAWSNTASDLVIVAFCGLVVAFFVTLNMYVFWTLAWWTQTRRPRKNVWTAFTGRALPAAGDAIKVTGRIERLGTEGDAVVLRDFWAGGALPWRLTEMAVFLVRPDDATREPVVVACTTAPDVEGHAEAATAPALLGLVSGEARALASEIKGSADDGMLLTLSEGDSVEVTAVLSEPVENLDRIPLPGGEILVGNPEGAPYRDQPEASPRSGLLLVDEARSPLRIRRLG